ncbi:hypothetical protein DFP72DRAFT_210382 [Ephemerocybe angulata]|uniref:Nephrocystin 3-like N-terminal domain-containing protein n=1 Tax=Ephemerocybe angulata TaxID=980116 RepID=A0A8H6I375_9AGAR|nr:hypothetical protein DFP72DRAFT_210382 [Tulosesus angulatus]
MDWIQARDAPQRLLYMTGAAGAGKSALQQTVSEQCAKHEILAASFFFNVGDDTRNNTAKVIPTIAYQLGQKNTAVRRLIRGAVENDPLIFNRALISQIQALILNPVSRLSPSEVSGLPYAILVDGLDECSDEESQREFLRVIDYCVAKVRTPFRFFIASRPELAILEALRPGGHLHKAAYPIQLSDGIRYIATADIRRTVTRSLRELGEMRNLEQTWFSEKDVDQIVEAASGQYIYAATVIRYVSQPRGDPETMLRAVLDWAPAGGKQSRAKPFASLDSLYTHILSKAKEEYEAIDTNENDFLMIFNSYCYLFGYVGEDVLDLPSYDQILGLEKGTYKTIIYDLRSLVTVKDEKLILYHKSLVDFLLDEGRSGSSCTELLEVLENTLFCCLQRVGEFSKMRPFPFIGIRGEVSESVVRLLAKIARVYLSICNQRSMFPCHVVDAFISFSKNGDSGWAFIDKMLLDRVVLTGGLNPYCKEGIMWETIRDFTWAFEYLLPLMKHQDKDPRARGILQDCYDQWSTWRPERWRTNKFIQDFEGAFTCKKLRRYYENYEKADRMDLHEMSNNHTST